jgi:hypothetical protein
MIPYQVYQLYQIERTKTSAEIRRADDQLGELSRALSSVRQHITLPSAALPRALMGAVAAAGSGLTWLAREHRPVPRPRRTERLALRRAEYLVHYHPRFPSGTPSAPSDRPDHCRA